MKIAILAATAASILVLSGCGSSTSEASDSVTSTPQAPSESPTPTESAPPADGGSFSSLADLQEAYVAAGGECSQWVQGNRVTLAAESGDCDGDTVLSTFISSDQIAELIQSNKDLHKELEMESDSVWLVGQNWVINSPDAVEIQEELGGQLVRY